ncbi:MAG: terpene cyclase/mutase family protein [Planctomycetota bacterium]|nr:terpene cyclase/mutase family protein [Planctomycetota bacterium]
MQSINKSLASWGICFAITAGIFGSLGFSGPARAEDAKPVASSGKVKKGVPTETLAKSRKSAIAYLRTTQSDDGRWSDYPGPAITGIVTTSLLKSGVEPSDPMIVKALAYLQTALQPDGGIYTKENKVSNYETSVALLAFAAANRDGKYDKLIAGARDYLKKLQWDESEGLSKDDYKYGGAGYGRSERPDLSNTAFLLDALKAAGVDEDDETMKKVVVFISRCQNLESEHNTTEFASKINDGGFYYTPAGGGNSQAGADDNGGLRSYASMTYAGLKSMIYAGVGPDDPRVKAAFKWLQKHYSLKENPGMGQKGLFYYYHTFAKALTAAKVDLMVDAAGTSHDWRKELGEHLVGIQRENGSWINTEAGWLEGDPNLVTAYGLLSLQYCDTPK